ncbi:MAG TPA: CAP domain-containing protein [Longimicrobiaceae bacterium]|nr:CAP domain-containing protein [Longimicrobiaceae bacterium]
MYAFHRTALLLALGISGCVEVGTVPAGPPSAPPPSSPPPSSAPVPAGVAAPAEGASRFVTLMNRHRQQVGCAPLVWHEGAARAAQAHSDDMWRRRYFSHTSPEGRDLEDRLDAAGVTRWRAIAENIAQINQGGQALLELWLASPGHRRNIEDCTYTHHGLGRAGDRWTHVFVF